MENASKALIIAGSILITLIVISLGIVVFNNFRDSSERNSSLTAEEIANFNNQFTKYSGESVAGSQVNDLIQKVISVNIASKNEGRAINDRYVEITFDSISGGSQTIKGDVTEGYTKSNTSYLNKVKSNQMYKVELEYTKGVITKINVTP